MPNLRKILLTGPHVSIAEMTLEDQPHFQRWLSESAELRQLINDKRVPTMDDQLNWFARVQQPDRRMFSLLVGDTLIGNAGFVDIDPVAKPPSSASPLVTACITAKAMEPRLPDWCCSMASTRWICPRSL